MKKLEKFFGILGLSLFVIGAVFKTLHIMGAGVSLVLSMFFLCLFYFPIQLISDWRSFSGWYNKTYLVIRFFCFFMAIVGAVTKYMHWPGAGLYAMLALVFLLLYLVIYFYRRSREDIVVKMSLSDLVIAIIGLIIFRNMIYSGTPGHVRSAVASQDFHVSQYNKGLYASNESLYDQLMETEATESIEFIRSRTTETTDYIRAMRPHLLQRFGFSEEKIGSDPMIMDFFYVFDNKDVPTREMFGTEEKPNTGKFSAVDLKNQISTYREDILGRLAEENVFLGTIGLGLETKVENENYWTHQKESWEREHLKYVSIGMVLSFLTTLENAVLLTEYNAYISMMMKMDLGEESRLMLELANTESKKAVQKSQDEIAGLKMEQRISELELQKSKATMGQQQTTIVLVSVAIGFVFILLILSTRAFVLKQRTNQVLDSQKKEIESQNEEIKDSINYARRIQEAILPPTKLVKEYLTNSFILYKPKDIVAGDFYWFDVQGDDIYFAAADCTGHGVPGAMVSVVCANALHRTVNEMKISEPAEILNKVRELVVETFEKSEHEVKDGMDISFCKLNLKTRKLTFSGAHNPLYRITMLNGEADEKTIKDESHMLLEYKGDKQPIGKFAHEKPFTQNEIQLNEGDSIYISSDGYPDQFGGENGRKYMYKRFKKFFLSIHQMELDQQKTKLNEEFENWRGNEEQIDDVCVIGVRV